ncbi:MAG: SusD/RagB family nutrient-binding outer membrane lipoprotein [Bacteroidales bacterium]
MKTVLYIALAAILLFAGCTDDFEELDKPKATSNQIDPGSLFTRSLVTGSGLSVGIWQWMHQISGSVYAQHFANIQTGANFTSDNYEPREWNEVWNWYYARSNFAPLHYNFHVIELSQELENPIMEAVARIWNVYMIQQLTDMYGDMPVFEAFESIKPAFDPQKDIYLHMFDEIETAIELIDTYRDAGYIGFGQSDVLYSGNLDHWVSFANSMGMRLALRASNTNEFDTEIRPFLENLNTAHTIDSDQETAKIIPDPDGPTYHVKNPLFFLHGWNEVRMSETMYDKLTELNDPRMEVFFAPNEDGEFAGLPNGQPHEELSEGYHDYFRPAYCNIGEFFIQDDTPHYLFTHAESSLLKAEAAYRGFINGSAEAYYNEAITASFKQFGITDQDIIDDYLSGPAQFDDSKALEQIYEQRWLALYPNGHEAWSLVRRAAHPEMQEPVYTFPGNDEMPRRKPFPGSERRHNAENYQAAVDRMGGDSQYTRIWWDGGN